LTTITTKSKRVLSGMRPTGRLHIGHYFGALQNWVKLQNDDDYECFYFIADWHALTSDYADTSAIAENSIQITIDYLASGLDPTKSTIFLQSLVPEHAELHLLLSMVTPLGWLERIPTYKEQIENVTNKDLHTYGFLGYPTLQTADIVMYSDPGKSLSVPVGEDQVSHVEFSRELVVRFNFFYGLEITDQLFDPGNYGHLEFILKAVALLESKGQIEPPPLRVLSPTEKNTCAQKILTVAREVGIENFLELMGGRRLFFVRSEKLTEPQPILTPTPRIPGLDGRKMSKSYGNAITLSESDADIRAKTKVMVTDPARKRRTDPGNPDICPVYDWHKLFSPKETLDWAAQGCRTAGIGCIECKAAMADNLIKWIEPVRARRLEYEQHPRRVLEILDNGSTEARKSAQQTMQRVREAIFNWSRKRQEISGTL
jgi:tryptophanyl-tRNA synthetase